MKTLPLYLRIIIGLIAGLALGLIVISLQLDSQWIINYVKPFGTLFMNLLKMIAIPLVAISLLLGILSLKDLAKLSSIGFRTLIIYLLTTIFAVTIGLLVVNLLGPGYRTPTDLRSSLSQQYQENVASIEDNASVSSPLQPLVDMVPDNIFQALTSNTAILQVVFFIVLLGIAFIRARSAAPMMPVLESINAALMQLVEIIMLFAPIGVFALMSSMVIETADSMDQALGLLGGLLWYSITVILGLATIVFVVYPVLLKIFTRVPVGHFFKSIRAVQLLAFSTSSSNATLPLTMKKSEEALGVPKEISSFVLPLGATINMDGTSLYQGVAAVFIAQVMGIELSLADQLTIVFTATLASIGSAGVPGSGLIMMVMILQAVGIPIEGLALILAVDRLLDMFRTVVNVTGDITVACLMTAFLGNQPGTDKEENYAN